MKKGDVVKFIQDCNLSISEASERFIVLEPRGDRVLVQAVCDMNLKPTFVYPASSLEVA